GAVAGAPAANAAPASAAPARRVHPRRHRAQAAAPARRAPGAGNPAGHAPVPPGAQPVNTSHPTRVIGHGTRAGCTSKAVVAAVRAGGVITFSCGPKPVTIVMRATAKVRNTSAQVVLDGGGKVTLSGAGKRRILYMD